MVNLKSFFYCNEFAKVRILNASFSVVEAKRAPSQNTMERSQQKKERKTARTHSIIPHCSQYPFMTSSTVAKTMLKAISAYVLYMISTSDIRVMASVSLVYGHSVNNEEIVN